ncbi:MAG: hypothetical protein NWR21_11455 [Verrucomicrobiales bacterium]|jgi:hypothetical protein|nr:hypothetical protein [Verrucomicrobiales bacterium]MDP4638731.1 hypothetical protein [Verrucomicrobiales bacterium]MDP4791794.1 hypothetical protein [Verrucomicrobiales bacterium]MDP4939921.1 hypothetical protein [Verrucomicrobiales bacterium]MDP5005910.1 hypothetical protein [Verrucomicrobiales bacterium]
MTYQDYLNESAGGTNSAVTGTLSACVRASRSGLESNPDHHLWNNRGTWWCHFTLHRADYTAERIRVSLKTRDVEVARSRRDELLGSLAR